MAFVAVPSLGLVFGAAIQQLGSASVTLGAWSATAAQVSAPWLILPFLIGASQRETRKAAVLGVVVTVSALFGYYAMTYSPLEIHPWSFDRFISGVIAVTTRGWYNPLYILGGLVTGPLFGWLGQRWRVHRSWSSAAIVSGAICLEPLARWVTGQLRGPGLVWAAEVGVGVAVASLFAYTRASTTPDRY